MSYTFVCPLQQQIVVNGISFLICTHSGEESGRHDWYYLKGGSDCHNYVQLKCCDASPLDGGNWVWGSSENVCAGIMDPCNDGPSCTRVAVGPCRGRQTTAPESFLTTEVVGAAGVNIDKYLDCTDRNCDDMIPIDFTGMGYRDYNSVTIPEKNYSEKTTPCRPCTM